MKKHRSRLLLALVIISLLAIAFILLSGILTNSTSKKDQNSANVPDILGETSFLNETPTPLFNLNQTVRNTFDNTKEIVTQKMVETQKNLVSSIEKEISTLTQSQIETLKFQICKDWGVIDVSPTRPD